MFCKVECLGNVIMIPCHKGVTITAIVLRLRTLYGLAATAQNTRIIAVQHNGRWVAH